MKPHFLAKHPCISVSLKSCVVYRVHYYMEDLVFSFPCRVLDVLSETFLLPFPCATGTHGEQKCRCLQPSASYLVIQNLCAFRVTFASSKQVTAWSHLVLQTHLTPGS